MLIDNFNRKHNYLRVSLTDKCNLNCFYCNPKDKNNSYIKQNILSYEDVISILEKFVALGINKIRFTGGEPLVRKDVDKFFDLITENPNFGGITFGITTNGIFLDKYLEKLELAKISNINISLDSLQPEKFRKITGSDSLEKVLKNIRLVKTKKFANVKINVVSAKNMNDSEIIDFVEFAIENDLNLRFIEFMPFSNNSWNNAEFISSNEIMEIIQNKFDYQQVESTSVNTKEYLIEGTNTIISTISPISQHFCDDCNRLRISSTGQLKLCLFSDKNEGLNLKEIINFNNFDFKNSIQNYLSKKKYKHPEIDELIKLNDLEMLSIGG